jgi:hypothetical protein
MVGLDPARSTVLVDDDASVQAMLGYLMKPVDPELFAKEVRVLLSRSPADVERRREVGLAEARERDRIEAAFNPKQ